MYFKIIAFPYPLNYLESISTYGGTNGYVPRNYKFVFQNWPSTSKGWSTIRCIFVLSVSKLTSATGWRWKTIFIWMYGGNGVVKSTTMHSNSSLKQLGFSSFLLSIVHKYALKPDALSKFNSVFLNSVTQFCNSFGPSFIRSRGRRGRPRFICMGLVIAVR